MHRAAPLALLVLGLLGSTVGARHAAPRSRMIDCWPVAADARLELRAYERGTPAAMELLVVRDTRPGERTCDPAGPDLAASLPPLVGPLPAAVRVEWTAARDWVAALVPSWAPDDTAHWGDTAALTPHVLRATDGQFSIRPVRASGGGVDSAHLQLTTTAGSMAVTLAISPTWAIVQSLRELANVFDPDGRADYDGVFLPGQVDRPVTTGRNPMCQGKYPEWEQRLGRGGVVHMQFVVGTSGRAELASARVLGVSPGDDFERAARELLQCLTYRPAQLRGRRVRMLVQQPFTFDARGRPLHGSND